MEKFSQFRDRGIVAHCVPSSLKSEPALTLTRIRHSTILSRTNPTFGNLLAISSFSLLRSPAHPAHLHLGVFFVFQMAAYRLVGQESFIMADIGNSWHLVDRSPNRRSEERVASRQHRYESHQSDPDLDLWLNTIRVSHSRVQ